MCTLFCSAWTARVRGCRVCSDSEVLVLTSVTHTRAELRSPLWAKKGVRPGQGGGGGGQHPPVLPEGLLYLSLSLSLTLYLSFSLFLLVPPFWWVHQSSALSSLSLSISLSLSLCPSLFLALSLSLCVYPSLSVSWKELLGYLHLLFLLLLFTAWAFMCQNMIFVLFTR